MDFGDRNYPLKALKKIAPKEQPDKDGRLRSHVKMAADPSVDDILAIDSSLIPPGFSHGLQIAIPQSPPQLDYQPREKPPPHQFQRPRAQPRQPRPTQLAPPPPIPLQAAQRSEQLQVQRQPSLQRKPQQSVARRKANSFCNWVRRKLWCLRANSPMEPNLRLPQPIEAQAVTGEGSHASNVDLKKSVHDPGDRGLSSVAKVMPAGSESVEGEGVKARPRERQVTFSDTVRTHIKTKYVTAEEYKQIRGMNAATGRIMYQIVKVRDGDDHPKDKVNPFTGGATRCKRRKPI